MVTEACKEAKKIILDCVPCINYLVKNRKNKEATIQALMDLGCKINIMTLAYAKQLGFQVRKTNVITQKIDSSLLQTFEMVIASFQVKDKLDRARFFQKLFLLAETNMEMVLKMPFLTFNNADIQFAEKKLTWRSYTAAEEISTTKWVKLINKKEFAKAALDEESKTFVVHVAALELSPKSAKMTMHSSQAAQITASKQDETFTKVLPKYADYTEVFSFDLAMELPKNNAINEHAIEL